MAKIEDLESKISAAVALIGSLRNENSDLRREVESLQSHLTLYNNENSRAQQILADAEGLRRKHEAAALKIERALASLNALRGGS